MSQAAPSIQNDNPLVYDPLRFQLKSMFSYELTNRVTLRLRNLKQRHNELSDDENEELSDLIIVEKYLNNRINELKPVT
jgi:hypothetical protein